MNSLRSIGRAIQYEAICHVDLYTAGEAPVQETRHWDEEGGRTRPGRSKEEAEDYRYFSDPDLVPIDPSPEWIDEIRAALPALPRARRQALLDLGGSPDPVALAVQRDLDGLVFAAVAHGADVERALVHAANNLAIDGAADLDPEHFAELIRMETSGQLTSTQAKTVLADMVSTGRRAPDLAAEAGFEAMDTGELEQLLDDIILAHPGEWQRFVEGEAKLQGMFTGQVMKATGGKADGKVIARLLAAKRQA